MARPTKHGLQYYNTDCDIFQNRKIRKLLLKYRGDGFLVFLFVLTEVYRDNGYYLSYDKDFVFDLSDRFKMDEGVIDGILRFCIYELALFDEIVFEKHQVLTSATIQDRWLLICKKAQRVNTELIEEFNLLDKKCGLTGMETSSSNEETTQKKIKKQSKEKKENSEKDIFISFTKFTEYRTRKFENLTEDFKAKLACYGINGPDIRLTDKPKRPYIDAVEVMVGIWNDIEWQNQLNLNFKIDDEKLSFHMKDFLKRYITSKANYDESGFKQHFTNTLNKKLNG